LEVQRDKQSFHHELHSEQALWFHIWVSNLSPRKMLVLLIDHKCSQQLSRLQKIVTGNLSMDISSHSAFLTMKVPYDEFRPVCSWMQISLSLTSSTLPS
jgi:hypothetical protein